jgi:hypothetical protein
VCGSSYHLTFFNCTYPAVVGLAYAEETASTLRYASQAKKIVNTVIINENPYVKMIKKVNAEK